MKNIFRNFLTLDSRVFASLLPRMTRTFVFSFLVFSFFSFPSFSSAYENEFQTISGNVTDVLPGDEIISVSLDGGLYVQSKEGELLSAFPKYFDGAVIYGNPNLIDYNSDNLKEIALNLRDISNNNKIVILNGVGTVLKELTLEKKSFGNLSVGNSDSDSFGEILYTAKDNTLRLIDNLETTPTEIEIMTSTSKIFASFFERDSDLEDEIFVSQKINGFYVVTIYDKINGVYTLLPSSNLVLGFVPRLEVTPIDVDSNGTLEYAVVGENEVGLFDASMHYLPGFPKIGLSKLKRTVFKSLSEGNEKTFSVETVSGEIISYNMTGDLKSSNIDPIGFQEDGYFDLSGKTRSVNGYGLVNLNQEAGSSIRLGETLHPGSGFTAKSPTIINTYPNSGEQEVAVDQSIKILFSTEMNGATLTSSNIGMTGSVSGNMNLNVAYDDNSKLLLITHDQPFKFAETVTVNLSSNIKSKTGLSLENYSFNFKSAEEEVKVINISPLDSSFNVSRNAKITIKLSKKINLATLNHTNIYAFGSKTGDIISDLEYDSVLDRITLKPKVDYASGEWVTLYIKPTLRFFDGSFLGQEIVTQFKTVPEYAVLEDFYSLAFRDNSLNTGYWENGEAGLGRIYKYTSLSDRSGQNQAEFGIRFGGSLMMGQAFKNINSTEKLSRIKVRLRLLNGSADPRLKLDIYKGDANGKPTGSKLGFAYSDGPSTLNYENLNFDFPVPVILVPNQMYAFTISAPYGNTEAYELIFASGASTPGGIKSTDTGATWTAPNYPYAFNYTTYKKTLEKYQTTSKLVSVGYDTGNQKNSFYEPAQFVTFGSNGKADLFFSDSEDGVNFSDWTKELPTLYKRYVRFKNELQTGSDQSDVKVKEVKLKYHEKDTSVASTFQVSSVFPYPDSENVAPGANIEVNFSENLDYSTINSDTVLVKSSFGYKLAGATSYDEATKKLTFIPDEDFSREGSIFVALTTGIKNSTGVNLKEEFSWRFSIGALAPPGSIRDLKLNELRSTEALIEFTAPGGDLDLGQANAYEIRFSDVPITNDSWATSTTLFNYTTMPKRYGEKEVIRVTGLPRGVRTYLAIRAKDDNGTLGTLSNILDFTTGDYANVPKDYLNISGALASSFSQIFLSPGDYMESFVIPENKILVGATPRFTKIAVPETIIMKNNSTIKNLTLSGGVEIIKNSQLITNEKINIDGVEITGVNRTGTGINYKGFGELKISNSKLSNLDKGILVEGNPANTVMMKLKLDFTEISDCNLALNTSSVQSTISDSIFTNAFLRIVNTNNSSLVKNYFKETTFDLNLNQVTFNNNALYSSEIRSRGITTIQGAMNVFYDVSKNLNAFSVEENSRIGSFKNFYVEGYKTFISSSSALSSTRVSDGRYFDVKNLKVGSVDISTSVTLQNLELRNKELGDLRVKDEFISFSHLGSPAPLITPEDKELIPPHPSGVQSYPVGPESIFIVFDKVDKAISYAVSYKNLKNGQEKKIITKENFLFIEVEAGSVYRINVRSQNHFKHLSQESISREVATPSKVPEVLETWPKNGDLQVPTNSLIRVKTSTVIDPTSLTNLTFKVFGDHSGLIGGNINFDHQTKSIIYNLGTAVSFVTGEEITVTLSTGIKSIFGFSLPASHTFSFNVLDSNMDSALLFNEDDSRVEIEPTEILDGKENKTIDVWVKLIDLDKEIPIVIKGVSSSPQDLEYGIVYSPERGFSGLLSDGSKIEYINYDEKKEVDALRWYHLRFTWSKSLKKAKLFVDAYLVKEKNLEITKTKENEYPLVFGAFKNSVTPKGAFVLDNLLLRNSYLPDIFVLPETPTVSSSDAVVSFPIISNLGTTIQDLIHSYVGVLTNTKFVSGRFNDNPYPSVLKTEPRNGEKNAPINTEVKVTLDSPISPDQELASAFSVADSSGGNIAGSLFFEESAGLIKDRKDFGIPGFSGGYVHDVIKNDDGFAVLWSEGSGGAYTSLRLSTFRNSVFLGTSIVSYDTSLTPTFDFARGLFISSRYYIFTSGRRWPAVPVPFLTFTSLDNNGVFIESKIVSQYGQDGRTYKLEISYNNGKIFILTDNVRPSYSSAAQLIFVDFNGNVLNQKFIMTLGNGNIWIEKKGDKYLVVYNNVIGNNNFGSKSQLLDSNFNTIVDDYFQLESIPGINCISANQHNCLLGGFTINKDISSVLIRGKMSNGYGYNNSYYVVNFDENGTYLNKTKLRCFHPYNNNQECQDSFTNLNSWQDKYIISGNNEFYIYSLEFKLLFDSSKSNIPSNSRFIKFEDGEIYLANDKKVSILDLKNGGNILKSQYRLSPAKNSLYQTDNEFYKPKIASSNNNILALKSSKNYPYGVDGMITDKYGNILKNISINNERIEYYQLASDGDNYFLVYKKYVYTNNYPTFSRIIKSDGSYNEATSFSSNFNDRDYSNILLSYDKKDGNYVMFSVKNEYPNNSKLYLTKISKEGLVLSDQLVYQGLGNINFYSYYNNQIVYPEILIGEYYLLPITYNGYGYIAINKNGTIKYGPSSGGLGKPFWNKGKVVFGNIEIDQNGNSTPLNINCPIGESSGKDIVCFDPHQSNYTIKTYDQNYNLISNIDTETTDRTFKTSTSFLYKVFFITERMYRSGNYYIYDYYFNSLTKDSRDTLSFKPTTNLALNKKYDVRLSGDRFSNVYGNSLASFDFSFETRDALSSNINGFDSIDPMVSGISSDLNNNTENDFGVLFSDLDSDKNLEIIKTGDSSLPLTLYHYQTGESAAYQDMTSGLGLTGITNVRYSLVSDFNNDSKKDLLIFSSTANSSTTKILYNNGNSSFSPYQINDSSNRIVEKKIIPADLDSDGDLDLIVNFGRGIYENSGGTFSYKGKIHNLSGTDFSLIDYDNDKKLDLILASKTPENGLRNLRLFKNKGGFNFEEVTQNQTWNISEKINSFDVGDYNNDGLEDVIVQSGDNGLKLFKNSYGLFKEISIPQSTESLSLNSIVSFQDFNNDGFLDIFINRSLFSPISFVQKSGTFILNNNLFPELSNKVDNLAFGDKDKDGDIDIIGGSFMAQATPGGLYLWENNLGESNNSNSWISFGFNSGSAVFNNALIKIKADILGNGAPVEMIKRLTPFSSNNSTKADFVTFGLGRATSILEAKVVWGDLSEQELLIEDLSLNEYYYISKTTGQETIDMINEKFDNTVYKSDLTMANWTGNGYVSGKPNLVDLDLSAIPESNLDFGGNKFVLQSFVPTKTALSDLYIMIKRNSTAADLTLDIYKEGNGVPVGSSLSKKTIPVSSILNTNFSFLQFNFEDYVMLNPAEKYVFVLSSPGSSEQAYSLALANKSPSFGSKASLDSGLNYGSESTLDVIFQSKNSGRFIETLPYDTTNQTSNFLYSDLLPSVEKIWYSASLDNINFSEWNENISEVHGRYLKVRTILKPDVTLNDFKVKYKKGEYNSAPVFNSTPLLSINEDIFYNYALSVTDLEGEDITLTLSVAPSWLSFSNGILSGTPTNNHVGSNPVSLKATDSYGNVSTQAFSIEVLNQNPIFLSIPIKSAFQNSAYSYDINASDEGHGLIYTVTGLPNWLHLESVNTGLLTGTPTANDLGSSTIQITAFDGFGTPINQSYILKVYTYGNPYGNLSENFDDESFRAPETTGVWSNSGVASLSSVGQILQSKSYDFEGGVTVTSIGLSVTSNGGQIQTFLRSSNDNLSFTDWTANLQSLKGRFFQFKVELVSLGTNTYSIDKITLNTKVNFPNIAPKIVSSPTTSVPENNYYSYALSIDDPDSSAFAYILDQAPIWLAVSSSGVVNGTPLSNHVGDSAVQIKVSDDNGGEVMQSFVLNVQDLPTPPNILTTEINWSEDYASTFAVSVDDPDVADHVVFSFSGLPNFVGYNYVNNLLEIAPDNSNVGTYLFNVIATDLYGLSDSGTLSLNVSNVPPRLINQPIISVNEDSFYAFDVSTDDDIYGVTFSAVTIPTWANLSSSTGLISGTPKNNHVGTNYVAIKATDNHGGISTFSWNVDVINTVPTITSTPINYTDEDNQYVYNVESVDEGQGNTSYSLITHPSWLTINPISGVVSGTPDNSNVGTFNLKVEVNDGNQGIASQTWTVTVNNRAPEITSNPILSAAEDSSYSYDITSDDEGIGTSSYSLISAPNWINFNSLSGVLSGTPLNSNVGNFPVSVIFNDGNSGTASQSFTLNVINTNDVPYFTSTPVLTGTEDTNYSYTVYASDDDSIHGNEILFFEAQTLPNWLTFDQSTHKLQGVPLNSNVGENQVILRVRDLAGAVILQSFTITVANTNDLPYFTSTPITQVAEDDNYLYSVQVHDDDLVHGSDLLSFEITSKPEWLSYNFTNNKFIGVPLNSNVGNNNLVSINVRDNSGIAIAQSFTISVSNTNDAPVFTSIPITTGGEDTFYAYALSATDDDLIHGNESLSFVAGSLPAWLSLSSGVLSGTPDNSNVGNNHVVVRVQDNSGDFDTASFDISISNRLPIFTNTPPTSTNLLEDSNYNFNIDSDDEGQGSTHYAIFSSSDFLTINSNTGVISGTPTNDHVGTNNIRVTLNDGNGGIIENSFNLVVQNVNPVITSTPLTVVNEDAHYNYDVNSTDEGQGNTTYSFIVTKSSKKFVDEYVDADRLEAGSRAMIVNWLSINSTTGVISGTPLNQDVGQYLAKVTVDDGNGGREEQNFQITVNNVNDAPYFTSIPVTEISEDANYFYQISASDDDLLIGQDALSFTAELLPNWLHFDAINLSLSGIPENSNIGSNNQVLLSVRDLSGTSSAQSFAVNVINANDPPGVSITSVYPALPMVGEEITMSAVGYDIDGDALSFSWQVPEASSITGVTSTSLSSELKLKINEAGTFAFSITVSDGNGGISSAEVSLEVNYCSTERFSCLIPNGSNADFINSRIDEASALGSSSQYYTVNFEEGTYLLDEVLWLRKFVNLMGVSTNSTILDGNDVTRVLQMEWGYQDAGVVSNLTITNGNSGNMAGGGIYLFNSDVTFKNVDITFNKSGNYGGGVYLYWADPKFINVMIYDNEAMIGGAISFRNSNPEFINSTIVRNSATMNGGGIHSYSDDSMPKLRNTIVVLNELEDVYFWGEFYDVNYSLFGDGVTGLSGSGNIAYSGDGSDLFKNFSLGDFRLKNNAVAVDAGDPDPDYNDPDGSRNDMGTFGGPGAVIPISIKIVKEIEFDDRKKVDLEEDKGIDELNILDIGKKLFNEIIDDNDESSNQENEDVTVKEESVVENNQSESESNKEENSVFQDILNVLSGVFS